MIIPGFVLRISAIRFPRLTCRINGTKGIIYLTFDDGPTPGVTETILDLLDSYHARATFFCQGSKASEFDYLYRQIMEKGHRVGNHSWSHPDGFLAGLRHYYADIEKAASIIPSALFRPPYGRIRPRALGSLSRHYRIILWSMMIPDYMSLKNPRHTARVFAGRVRDGEIIVMHDSQLAKENLLQILPAFLEVVTRAGFVLEALPVMDKGN